MSAYVLNAILYAVGSDTIEPVAEQCDKQSNQIFEHTSVETSIQPNHGKHFEFKGISINGASNTVVRSLERQGYTFVDGGEDGALLTGKFAGFDNCQILVSTSTHTKQTFMVSIFTPQNLNWWGVKADYDRIKELLGKKYGKSVAQTEFFSSPYEEGDGYELTAFSSGNAVFTTKYSDGIGEVSVMITKNARLIISYTDIVNKDEHDKAENIMAENDI